MRPETTHYPMREDRPERPEDWVEQVGEDAGAQPDTRPAAGAVETAVRPDYAAQIAEVEWHWQMTQKICAQDADFGRLLTFLEWLLNWWEAVDAEDHAWLDGQIRRHIPDYVESLTRPDGESPEGPSADPGVTQDPP
jgi:hypothetical protein